MSKSELPKLPEPCVDNRGVPQCTEDCGRYDGKRCELLGYRPSAVCEPAVKTMAAKLAALQRELEQERAARILDATRAADELRVRAVVAESRHQPSAPERRPCPQCGVSLDLHRMGHICRTSVPERPAEKCKHCRMGVIPGGLYGSEPCPRCKGSGFAPRESDLACTHAHKSAELAASVEWWCRDCGALKCHGCAPMIPGESDPSATSERTHGEANMHVERSRPGEPQPEEVRVRGPQQEGAEEAKAVEVARPSSGGVPDPISKQCVGERCTLCGKPATRKVAEEMLFDEPFKRHPYTAYVCAEHFSAIMFPERR